MKSLCATMFFVGTLSQSMAQSVGDPALMAKQQRNAEVAAEIIRQEPLYQEGVLAGARMRREQEAKAAREAANQAVIESNAAVARAEDNLRAAERSADRNLRSLEAEMTVRRTIAIESMAHRRR